MLLGAPKAGDAVEALNGDAAGSDPGADEAPRPARDELLQQTGLTAATTCSHDDHAATDQICYAEEEEEAVAPPQTEMPADLKRLHDDYTAHRSFASYSC
jgi:hypothetical protein